MEEYAYSKITQDVLKVYRLMRILVIFWIVIAGLYALGDMFYKETNRFTTFENYWPPTIPRLSNQIYAATLNVFKLISASTPIFFMVLYTCLSLRASRILASSSAKPLLVFWFVQAFNFVFVLSDNVEVVSPENFKIDPDSSLLSVGIVLLVASPFATFKLLQKKRKVDQSENTDDRFEFYEFLRGNPLYKIPYFELRNPNQ